MKDFEISYLEKKDYLSVLYLDHNYLKYLFFSMWINYVLDMVLQWLSSRKPRWSRGVVVINFMQLILNSGSTQVQILLPAGNKAKRLSLVNHTTKTIHHQFIHHIHQHRGKRMENVCRVHWHCLLNK